LALGPKVLIEICVSGFNK